MAALPDTHTHATCINTNTHYDDNTELTYQAYILPTKPGKPISTPF